MQPTPELIRTIANRYAANLTLCFPLRRASLQLARAIHANIITFGFHPRAHILNRLIDVYCKSSELAYARHLFDEIPEPDRIARTTMVSGYSASGEIPLARNIFDETPLTMRDTVMYNAMITGLAHARDGYSAASTFLEMKRGGFRPDNFTFASVLSGLANVAEEERDCVRQFHAAAVKSGACSVTSVTNALVSVYSKFDLLQSARRVFDEISDKDERTWTSMMTGYVKNGFFDSGVELLEGMMDERMKLVAFNALISGYVHGGLCREALEMVRRMVSCGIELDAFTYPSVLRACATSGLLQVGKQVHGYALRRGEFSFHLDNSLVSLYYKCGRFDEARAVFDRMEEKDLVSWNALLSGYVSSGHIGEAKSLFKEMGEKKNMLTWMIMISGLADNGFGEEGLRLFACMRKEGFEPCDYAFSGAIKSCAVLGGYCNGQQFHAQLVKIGFDCSLSAANALITMYARCGVVEEARRVFRTMSCKDSVSWNALIAALGQHGHGAEAVDVYEEMLKEGIKPDRITFLTVLTACSHAGLVDQGRRYFDSMESVYCIPPGADHYSRLIDLLCRSGRFSEAESVIKSLPFEPTAQIWEALLSGCRVYGNMELGIVAAEKLFELIPEHDGTYMLLSNMYAATGKWEEAARVRKLMRDRGVKKELACSWIEVETQVHKFLVDDTSHPEAEAVYSYLQELGKEMRRLGYVPDTNFVLHDVESDGHKQDMLITHSEKIAVAFGLMKLPPRRAIRVFKNLRTCGDCHNFFVYLSRVVQRDIVLRDRKRFHHFRNGECSCGNFW
ncbi:Pentatricopeptide repeat-containing protein [Raphanus sativus]|uniref:Pentatricopeptide repeat-containing protein At1g25360-like n=1 Tax=Raphanus sativus TaxID=3726 RepID=A0A6J0KM47_RAPSA|nr:pentatricopeptide repeat-containing protein At1g25360-like [Raphanus sativus]KAJ4868232.1 Pentatricopeptide repeat-containing protein [Raphanus sativus]